MKNQLEWAKHYIRVYDAEAKQRPELTKAEYHLCFLAQAIIADAEGDK